MAVTDDLRAWWQQTLLGQQSSAHPVFGSGIHVQVDGDAVTHTGTVQTAEEIEEAEREVKALALVKTVVNHLSAAQSSDTYRMQTVLAVFPSENAAEIARQATTAWTVRDDAPPDVFLNRAEAERGLKPWVAAARVPESVLDPYLEALEDGKVMLADRVPEDDCLRIVSALEGTNAEMLRTLPPEPEGDEAE
jgi:hypothetical protein